MRGGAGFWDIDEPYVRLSEAGDPLEKLNTVVPFFPQAFGQGAEAVRWRQRRPAALRCGDNVQDHGAAGALQSLGRSGRVSDPRPVFLHAVPRAGARRQGSRRQNDLVFREHLTQARAAESLFARFDKHLGKAGYLAMGGQIVDATIVAAPKQRNSDAERPDIKAGKVPDECQKKPAKLRQKDRDALDGEVLEGQGRRGGKDGAARYRRSRLRLQEPCLDRSPHGFIRGWNDTNCSAYDGAQLRTVLYKNTIGSRPADERGDGTGQWPTLKNPRFAQHKSRRGLFSGGPSVSRWPDKDRHGQSRLQFHPPCLAPRANCPRMLARKTQPRCRNRHQQSAPTTETEPTGAHQAVRNGTTGRGNAGSSRCPATYDACHQSPDRYWTCMKTKI